MSRSTDPKVRSDLLHSAARLIAQHGPDAVSTRKVAAEANTSSMAVYTHFGSIGGLISSVIEDGFAALAEELESVESTDDPVRDLLALLLTSIGFARREPKLYEVLFVTASLGKYRRSAPTEMLTGRDGTFRRVEEACHRACSAGRFVTDSDISPLAYQWWSAVHGYAMLEVAGFIDPAPGSEKVLLPLLRTLAHGLGDAPIDTEMSLRSALAGSHN
ncbi:TetR/AcrR family transcriptional regulator [Rhodococcus sovatensis]|uniref:TetR/AcrR family transcriptional regulator n=1 Tax=Rhodococcus sovatensis TaxID=1805840 RepID=A0ABZ2PP11_9NOCA